MHTHIADLTSKHFAGLAVRTSNSLEKQPGRDQIPSLWQRFFSEDLHHELNKVLDAECIYGVYTHYEGNSYQLLAGYEIAAHTPVPANLCTVQLPAARYLVFPASGELPQAVFDGWQSIKGYFAQQSTYRRSFSGDFECYRGDTINIYVAVTEIK